MAMEKEKILIKRKNFEIECSGNENIPKLIEQVKVAYRKNKDFFSFDLPHFKIKLVYSRKDFTDIINKINKHNGLAWLRVSEQSLSSVGGINAKENKIVIFSQTVFDKCTLNSKEGFMHGLTHEMCHLFVRVLTNLPYPMQNEFCWLEEGIAGVIALDKYTKLKPKRFDFTKIKTYKDWIKYNYPYAASILLAEYIIKTEGKQKVLKFFASLKAKNPNAAFKKVFNKNLLTIQKDYNEKLT